MAKITLDFEVNDRGIATLRQSVGQASDALTKLGSSAAVATQKMDPLSQLQAEMGQQFDATRTRLNSLAQSFDTLGQRSAVSLAGLRSAGLAVGAALYSFVRYQENIQGIADRFAAVDMAIRRMDLGALQKGMQDVSLELERSDRQLSTWGGTFALAVSNISRVLTFMPTTIRESTMALQALREGMAQVLPLQMEQEAAGAAGRMSALKVQQRQQLFGSFLNRGMAGEWSIGNNAEVLKRAVQEGVTAAETQIRIQRQREFLEAGARGTLDIESPAIQARYAQRLAELLAKRDLQLGQIDEQARQQLEGARNLEEQRRAAAAGRGISAQQALIDSLRLQQAGSAETRAQNLAWMKGKGFAPWLQTSQLEDPYAKQMIQEQKQLKLMQIDEVLQKELQAIERLKLADDERIQARAQAEATAQQQRQNAIDQALASERQLDQAVSSQLTAALADVGTSIDSNITQKLKDASAAAIDLAGEVAAVQSRAYESSGAAAKGITWDEYRRSWRVTPGPGGTGGLDWTPPKIPPQGWDTGTEAGPPEYAGEFASGGIVPGPIGAPRMAMVHGGETITPAGGAMVNITVNGSREDPELLARRIARNIDREISRLASRGQSRMGRA